MTSARAETETERAAKASKDEAILTLLGQLAIVYWRPDFSASQARQFYAQYLDDLRPYALSDINDAIIAYRRNKDEKFYPLPGQLRGMIEKVPSWETISRTEHIRERLAAAGAEMAKMIEATASSPQVEHRK